MSVSDQNPGIDQSRVAQFNTTHWSVVVAAGQSSSPAAEAALEQLCRAYWYPLYCYAALVIRRKTPRTSPRNSSPGCSRKITLPWPVANGVVSVPFCSRR